MSPSLFLKGKAIVTVITALVLLFVPYVLATLIGVELNNGSAAFARLIGAIYLSGGLLLWFAGADGRMSARDACLNAVGEIGQALVVLLATLSGTLNGLGWVLLAAYAYYAIGFLYLAKTA